MFSPSRGLLDTDKFGVIGLSMGGGGCIEATGAAGSEVDAAVALAPATSEASSAAAQNIGVPIQIQVGSVDTMVPPETVLYYYTNLIPGTTVKEYVEINGGSHSGFIDEFFAWIAVLLGIDTPADITFAQQVLDPVFFEEFENTLGLVVDDLLLPFQKRLQVMMESPLNLDAEFPGPSEIFKNIRG